MKKLLTLIISIAVIMSMSAYGEVEVAGCKSVVQDARVGLFAAQWIVVEHTNELEDEERIEAALAIVAVLNGGTDDVVLPDGEIITADSIVEDFEKKIDGVCFPYLASYKKVIETGSAEGFSDIEYDIEKLTVTGITFVIEKHVIEIRTAGRTAVYKRGGIEEDTTTRNLVIAFVFVVVILLGVIVVLVRELRRVKYGREETNPPVGCADIPLLRKGALAEEIKCVPYDISDVNKTEETL